MNSSAEIIPAPIEGRHVDTGQFDWRNALVVGAFAFPILLIVNEPLTALGISWFVFLFALFIIRLGKTIPIMELMLLIAGLQWIVGARTGYILNDDHWRYHMYVPEFEYMSLVVPGTIAFSLGVLLMIPKHDFDQVHNDLRLYSMSKPKVAYTMIIVGLVAEIYSPYKPASIGFLIYLIIGFKYVGLALMLFSTNSKMKRVWLVIILGILALNSIYLGMFHDLVLWGALISCFLFLERQYSVRAKILIIGLGLFLMVVLQSAKGEFREGRSDLNNQQKIERFFSVIAKRLIYFEDIAQSGMVDLINVRFNQGWIISAIMENVPESEPYAKGETFIEALENAIVPRLFNQDKKLAGGQENFRRLTGLTIGDGTSMGTSIIGEAYGNFGRGGAIFFMFFWGGLIAWVFGKLLKYASKSPLSLVFIPLVFFQVIKAETELYVVLNHFLKSLFFVGFFLWFARKILGW